MAREHKVIVGSFDDSIEEKIDEVFAEYPRTAKIDSFSPVVRGTIIEWVALVSWDSDAEARRPRVMEGR